MLGLGSSLARGGFSLLTYIKDGLKLFMPYKKGDGEVQFVGTGSTSFDGGTDYIAVADSDSLSITGAISISLWVKVSSVNANEDGLVVKANDSGVGYGIYIDQVDNKIKFFSHLYSHTADSAAISLNTWYHVVGTHESGSVDESKIYIDGSLIHTFSETDVMVADSEPLEFGRTFQNSGYTLNGSLKNVAIWNRALTATEVQNVMYKTYAEVSGRLASGLVSWWGLDVDYTDSKGSNDGTNSGSTLSTSLYGGNTPVIPRAVDNAPTVQADAIGSGSASFNGTDDYIDVGDSNNFITGNNVTFACWVKNTGSAKAYVINNTKGASGSTNMTLSVNNDSGGSASAGEISGLVWSGSAHGYITYDGNIDDSTWHHLALTTTSSAQVLYLDGVSVATTSHTFANAASTDNMIIGNDGGNSFEHTGNICQVGIWSAALTQAQIQSVMEKTFEELTASEKTDLVSYWSLDETIESSGSGASFVYDKVDETTTQMFTNPDFTSNVTGWGGTSNCSLDFSSGSLRQTSSSTANSQFTPSSSGFSATTTAIRVEAKCTIISGTQTPRFEIRDGANANWVYNSGTTVGAVITFDFYMAGANDEANVHIQLRGSSSGVADWDYIKMTKYDGNTGQLI